MAPFLINTGLRTRIAQSLAIVATFVAFWLPGCVVNEKIKLAANGAPDAFWAPAARKVVEDLKPILRNAGN